MRDAAEHLIGDVHEGDAEDGGDQCERDRCALVSAVADSRTEEARWKEKANELSAKLSDAERAGERLPRVERQLQQWKARDEMHAAKLAEVRDRMRRAEKAAALSQEHLLATETKLDVIEAALGVLDRRTRKPL